MSVDNGLMNRMFSSMGTTSTMQVLREQREQTLAKLRGGDAENQGNCAVSDIKQVIIEINAIDKAIQQSIYEETTRKIVKERLEQEEARAKNVLDRNRNRKDQEGRLVAASMEKLLCACNKAKSGSGSDEEISRDLKESVKLGIEAAAVARRRKREEYRETAEEEAKDSMAVKHGVGIKKRRKRKTLDIRA